MNKWRLARRRQVANRGNPQSVSAQTTDTPVSALSRDEIERLAADIAAAPLVTQTA